MALTFSPPPHAPRTDPAISRAGSARANSLGIIRRFPRTPIVLPARPWSGGARSKPSAPSIVDLRSSEPS